MADRPGQLVLSNSLVILITTAIFCAVAVWMVIPVPPAGFYWDDTWYILMAESLSGRFDHLQLTQEMLQLRQYPPLFPFILSLTGEILIDQHYAFIFNALFLALGVGVAMIWFAREGFTITTSVLAAIVLMFNPIALYWLPILFSEPLFILLTSLALALASYRSDKFVYWMGIGFVVGLSVATRSAGWPLAVGMLVYLIFDQKLKPSTGFISGLAMGLVSIPILKMGFPQSRSYQESIFQTLQSFDLDYLTQQIWAILTGWQLLWGSTVGAVLAAVFVIPGIGIRLIRNRPDAWYILIYLAMLVVWPFPEHMSRFLWPLLPAFLVSAHSAVALFRNQKYSSVVASLFLVSVFVFSVPGGIGISLERTVNPPPAELHDLSRMMEWMRSVDREVGVDVLKTRRQFLLDMQRINRLADDNFCVYSELSMMVTSHTQRVAFASPWKNLQEVDSHQFKCPYYYLVPSSLPNTTAADVEKFASQHKELFRSLAPYNSEGNQLLGVFFALRRQ